ncbi:cation/H(+) antiporter 15-like [Telopea speciosissima]|uniref:cation/H(+) antiporter 15-like n=1 Tax=Telopea speciosissima TaxID=54955 RepID=UPI001CC6C075|nr:cation/H(+) antiporter 15-like [Telopea speciosissima]
MASGCRLRRLLQKANERHARERSKEERETIHRAGIIIGPTGLCRDKNVAAMLFPEEAKLVFDTIAWFGVMIYIFLFSVKMDLIIVKQAGRKAIVIGFSTVLLPVALCLIISFVLRQYVPSDSHLFYSLPYIAISQCIVPFVVVTCLLTELKTLNTDLGRLAVSSSVYADLAGISVTLFAYNLGISRAGSSLIPLWAVFSALALVAFIFLVLRPLMNWVNNQISDAKPVKDSHFCAVLLLTFITGFISLLTGQNVMLGPLIFGLVVPKGPPLGSALDQKLDTMVSAVFLPSFFLMCGLHADLSIIRPMVAGVVGIVALLGFLSRMTAVFFSSLYYNIPIRDGVVVGLMLNNRGIAELITFKILNNAKIFDDEEYATALLTILLITGITTPILRFLHDPSQSYTPTNRRTIQDMKLNSDLRMLVCIRKQENVPTMINLIEVSHANRENPISIIVLRLVELVGRASPILVDQMIFNAFKQYKLLNEDSINIQQFTAISHVATMHDDVCQVACDKRATIIIVPFHKEWAIDGSINSVNCGLRAMNRNILKRAPCSVGILVDRGIIIQAGHFSVVTSRASIYRVVVLLIGGPDDDEAFAYGSRIALHRHVKVTVIFLNDINMISKKKMERYQHINEMNKQMEYREEEVTDGEKLAVLIRDILEEGNDLTIVGRRQGRNSPVFLGLTEWNECPELGLIGDMLASPDFGTTSSILVLQQQRQLCNQSRTSRRGGGSFDLLNYGLKSHMRDLSIHDVPMDENDETKHVGDDKEHKWKNYGKISRKDNDFDFEKVLHLLANAKKYGEIRSLLDSFVKSERHFNVSFFHMIAVLSNGFRSNSMIIVDMLILAYVRNSRSNSALEAFQRAGDYGFRLSILSCNPLLNALVKERKVATVETLFKEMIRRRITPNSITFNTVINGLCKIGKLQKAKDLVEDMKSWGC